MPYFFFLKKKILNSREKKCLKDNSNTARLYRQWRKIVFYSATNSLGGNAWRYFAPFGRHFDFLVTSIFSSMMLDGVTAFSRIENVRNT